MKYELGDKVRITQCWKNANFQEQAIAKGITGEDALKEYLESDEMAGTTLSFDKHRKYPIDETGIIVGIRKIKTRYGLWHVYQDSFDTGMGIMPEVDRIEQESATYERIYLVATRMNCLRKVSFEDIVFIS